MPTAIGSWQLEMAVEVRRCKLRSGAGKDEEEEDRQPLIKSNNPYGRWKNRSESDPQVGHTILTSFDILHTSAYTLLSGILSESIFGMSSGPCPAASRAREMESRVWQGRSEWDSSEGVAPLSKSRDPHLAGVEEAYSIPI